MKLSVAALSLASFAGLALAADFKITKPGGPDQWWIAASDNVVEWDCKNAPAQTFTISIANKDVKVLAAPMPFISIQQNADCSKLITKEQMGAAPGTGYTIQLSNPVNLTQVYAESQEFEIKPIGSAYPTSTTPKDPSSTTGGGESPTSTQPGGALGLSVPMGGLLAGAFAVSGLIFA